MMPGLPVPATPATPATHQLHQQLHPVTSQPGCESPTNVSEFAQSRFNGPGPAWFAVTVLLLLSIIHQVASEDILTLLEYAPPICSPHGIIMSDVECRDDQFTYIPTAAPHCRAALPILSLYFSILALPHLLLVPCDMDYETAGNSRGLAFSAFRCCFFSIRSRELAKIVAGFQHLCLCPFRLYPTSCPWETFSPRLILGLLEHEVVHLRFTHDNFELSFIGR